MKDFNVKVLGTATVDETHRLISPGMDITVRAESKAEAIKKVLKNLSETEGYAFDEEYGVGFFVARLEAIERKKHLWER